MARTSFPPGFRFHPTDVELVKYYLKRKVMGKSHQFDAISELNIYKYSPWDLADKSCLRSKDLEWYFFCPNERKYASGARTNRATESGYWKSTGKDRPVLYKEQSVGMVKTLVYHIGHAPKGERTDWVMYEYRIQDKELAYAGTVQDAYVLCKVFQKSGPGPKANAQYGAPFCEEDWDDDAEFCGLSLPSNSLLPPVLPYNNSISVGTSMFIPESTFSGPSSKPSPLNVLPSSDEVLPAFPDNENFICLSDIAKDNNFMLPDHTVNNEVGENFSDKNNIDGLTCMDGDEMGYGFGDLDILLELSGGGFNEINSEGLSCLDVDGMDYSLGDLDNWPELSGGGFSFPNNQTTNYDGIPFVAGDIEFLELNDLNAPLNFHTDATRSQDSLTDILYEPFYNNNNGGDYLPVDMFDAAQDFAILDQLFPLLPEGYNGHGDHFDLLEENSGVTESTNLGFTARSCDGNFTPGEQPEDGTGRHAGEDNNRGQRISYMRLQQLLESIPAHHSTYGGSSIHVKAEVTPSVVGALKTLCSKTWGSLYLKTAGATSPLRVWGKKWLNGCNLFLGYIFC